MHGRIASCGQTHVRQSVSNKPQQPQPPQQPGVSPKRAHCFVASPFLMDPSEQPVTGAAQRRKKRRLRSWWRHEQQSIAAALATSLHHSSRGQRKAKAGEEESEKKYTAKFRKTPLLQAVFQLYDEEDAERGGAAWVGL